MDVEPAFGYLKASLVFHRFHLRGKQGATIDIGLALMALNLRKLGKYMERKVRITKNKFDFENKHQNRTYFLFEKELLSRSQIIEPLKKWLNDRQQRSFDRFFFSSYFSFL